MSSERPIDFLVSLVHELCTLPKETEWVEFKENNANPDEIGEYISALANAAALQGKAFAYLVWGVHDAEHVIVGTSLNCSNDKRFSFKSFKSSFEGLNSL